MPRYTRKRGGGLFDLFKSKGPTPQQQIANLELQKAAAKRKSQSRVANIMNTPGEVVYTNKARINSEFNEKIKALMSQIEQPAETASALNQVSTSISNALKSQAARETGAVVITIPFGIAQLAVKAMRLFLAVMLFMFGIAPAVLTDPSVLTSAIAIVAPNAKFNTTAAIYKNARRYTGANKTNAAVQEYT